MKRAEWIEDFKDAFSDLLCAVRDAMEKPSARSLSRAQRRELCEDAACTIYYLLDHLPDDGAPGTAAAPPPGPPANPAAAHRRQAKRTLLRFFNLCLPTYATGQVADEIESIVDDIVDAAVAEVRRSDAAARAGATRNPA